MSRSERLLLLVFFDVVLLLLALGTGELVLTALAAVAGGSAGVAIAGRLKRLSGRMDARIGVVEQRPKGILVSRVGVRAGLHLVVVGVLWASTVFVPFVGDELFVGAAAAVTAFAAVLTAWRLGR